MSRKDSPHTVAIIGPTASGKSGLAIKIAKKYEGEIVSVDSRQIYRGMNLGTGKVVRDSSFPSPQTKGGLGSGDDNDTHTLPPAKRQRAPLSQGKQELYLSEGISHHLLDIIDPNESYNVTRFQRDAQAALQDIQSRGRLPILCGGTGFWMQALVEHQKFPEVEPDWQLREELSKLSREELFERLRVLDPMRAETIDRHNPVRLIRAIEIAVNQQKTVNNKQPPTPACNDVVPSGKPLPKGEGDICSLFPVSCSLIIALAPPIEILREKIKKRLDERFEQGMIEEVIHLHEAGVSWQKLEGFGLEYKWIAYYLQGKVTEQEMHEKLYFDIVHYAKRQLTWLRRWEKQGAKIHWMDAPEKAFAITDQYLSH
jgi:tRNA dimethylallyltransferase